MAQTPWVPDGGSYSPEKQRDQTRINEGTWKGFKPWKLKKGKHRMVLGGDIGLEETCNLALCMLVGRFTYRAIYR
jgi:hypothetical protein